MLLFGLTRRMFSVQTFRSSPSLVTLYRHRYEAYNAAQLPKPANLRALQLYCRPLIFQRLGSHSPLSRGDATLVVGRFAESEFDQQ